MKLSIYQVDAFTSHLFSGNPAAVIPLEDWLEDELLQSIAMENNLSETAFFVNKGNYYHLRWFTPTIEIELCGHATLASAHVLFKELGFEKDTIHFKTLSGSLYVKMENELLLTMDFPLTVMKQIPLSDKINCALGKNACELWESRTKFMAVFEDEKTIQSMIPDFKILKDFKKNIIVTAKGDQCDFVSRFFAPASGIDEDPVTGSAHTALAPYWSRKLSKNILEARQLSKRGGEITCELIGERVLLKGASKLYMRGEIFID